MDRFGEKVIFVIGHAALFEVGAACEIVSAIGDYAARTLPKVQKAYHDAFDPDPESEESSSEE
jgi:hypothetical protein